MRENNQEKKRKHNQKDELQDKKHHYEEKMKLELCFIQVLLSLTLNITPASLGSDCYLGTLNWNSKNWMEVLWKNMSDFYLFIISKRNWFSWPVLIHVRIGGWFSIWFSHVTMSIGLTVRTKLKTGSRTGWQFENCQTLNSTPSSTPLGGKILNTPSNLPWVYRHPDWYHGESKN